MSRDRSWRVALTALVCAAFLSACGSSSVAATTPTPSPTPPALPTPTAASPLCPTAAAVGSTLAGITLPKPVGIAGAGTAQLPAGAKGIVCEYHASTYNVIIVIITNIDPSNVAQFSSHFPVPYTSVSGVGDQARAFSVPIGGGRINEGVVASKGRKIVSIDATATPATLAQVEALVNQLL